jgi:hypothetical protein
MNSKQQRTCFKTGVYRYLITLKQLLPIHTYTRVSTHPCVHTRTREHFMHSTTTSLTHAITNTPMSLSFHPSCIHQFNLSYMRVSTLPLRHFTDFKAEGLLRWVKWHSTLRSSPASVIRPKLHVHSFISHQRHVISADGSVIT